MEKRLKRVGIISLVVVGVLVVAAVVVGVLNALVADGEWTFGWNDYRYDESGYTAGQGTIPADRLTGIELDWIDGTVEIVACEDTFPSVSESASDDLPESARLRWKVDENGVLHIKYRKASWFFGFGGGDREKKLTLRVPVRFFEDLEKVEIEVESAHVVIDGLLAKELDMESSAGSLTVKNSSFASVSVETVSGKVELGSSVCPDRLDIETASGDVTLQLPKDASFVLTWESKSGKISSDFLLSQSGDTYTCKDGKAAFAIESKRGDLILSALE